MLNKLQRDILKRHIGPFIFCFFTVLFLLLMQFLMLYIENLVGKGLPIGVVIELILTNLAYMVVLAAPMAVLVSSLMAFGKFSELNELTALRAAGVNPFYIIKPVLGAAALMALFLIWFSNDVLPDANQKARSLFIDIRLKKPGFDLKENEFYEGIDGYTFLVDQISGESDSLYDVTLFQDPSSTTKKAVIRAAKGYLASAPGGETLTLFLFDGTVVRFMERRDNQTLVDLTEETRFDRYRISFDLSELSFSRSNPEKHSRNDRTMNVQSMMAVVDSLDREIEEEKQKVFKKTNFFASPVNGDEQTATTSLELAGSGPDSTGSPPYESNYYLLNQLENRGTQKEIHNGALEGLRKYRSSFENLNTNIDWRISRIARYLVEIHKKFSIPIACIIFVLIGAPIAMYTKKGNLGYAGLIGTVFLTIYWISIIQGEKLADRLYISPFTGMWLSNIILAVAGIVMVLDLCTSLKLSKLWKRRD